MERVDQPRVMTAVIIIVNEQNQVLVEQRPESSSFRGKLLFPAGTVEDDERHDPILAVRREALQELGLTDLQLKLLESNAPIIGETGRLLIPYLVTSWTGSIPGRVLDTDSELLWKDLDVFDSDLTSMQQLLSCLRIELEKF